jgi:hypothetical protein
MNFFRARSAWNGRLAWELVISAFSKADRDGAAMSQQLPSWRTGKDQTLWLSRLIEAMEKFSRAEWRSRPVDRLELAAVRARLALPASAYSSYASRFSLRN